MKPATLWVLLDSKGRPWRYTNQKPVTYISRRDALFDSLALDPKRLWKPAKAALTVAERP